MNSLNEIKAGILRVEQSKSRVLDPNGRYPVCIPGIGTGICERCGQRIKPASQITEACSAVPPEQRWNTVNE